jgi:hypothetical protein
MLPKEVQDVLQKREEAAKPEPPPEGDEPSPDEPTGSKTRIAPKKKK